MGACLCLWMDYSVDGVSLLEDGGADATDSRIVGIHGSGTTFDGSGAFP